MDNSLSRTNTNSSRTRALHDKTSYNIIPTPPSPTNTSPTLTQSTSNSNSASTPSTSPPQPTTPRSNRSRTRYPDLGRVPLHRRGTSKTYERLEDLLREAGYKETRVFTPEGERGESRTLERDGVDSRAEQRGSVRGGVGALVGFLAGFMPNTAASRSTSSLDVNADGEHRPVTELPFRSPHIYSPPVSPLAHRQLQKQKQSTPSSSEPHSPSLMTSSMESLDPTPRPSRHNHSSRSTTPVQNHSQLPHQGLQRPQHLLVHRVSDQPTHTASHRPPLTSQNSRNSFQQQPGNYASHAGPSQQQISHPQPSRAGAYLRHMASAPNMPKRPISTPTHSHASQALIPNNSDSAIATASYNHENLTEPPLPRTWLESVARAVLFGGVGAYIGGPYLGGPPPQHHNTASTLSAHGKTLRPTRSSISQVSPQHRSKHLRPPSARSGLSDRTNTRRGGTNDLLLAPPELFTRIERGRSGTSAGEVSRTRVVCRSAPASRASSRVRTGGEEKRDGGRDGKEREHVRGRGRGRREEKERDGNRLPSLANTNTEGDGWARNKRVRPPIAHPGDSRNRYLGGWGGEPESSEDEDRQSSSEEEGELDLARMLVPPKRQNSIKSLRKHLVVATGESASAHLVRATAAGRMGRGASGAAVRGARSGGARGAQEDWDGNEAEEWGRGWVRKSARRRASEDDDDENYAAGFLAGERGERLERNGSGRSGTGKGRLALPGPWNFTAGGS